VDLANIYYIYINLLLTVCSNTNKILQASVYVTNTQTGTPFVVIYRNSHRNAALAKHTLIHPVFVRHSFIYSIHVVLGILMFDSSNLISVYEYVI
jgi:hypothetical protein